MPKTDKQILDEALAAQAMGRYEDPVASAKKFLSKRHVVDDADILARNSPAQTEIDRSKYGEHNIGQVIGDTASAAMLPLSFAAGPVGAIAGGATLLNEVPAFMKNPSALGALSLGIGAIPAFRAMGRMGRTAGMADEAPKLLTEADEFGRAAMFDDVASRQPKGGSQSTTFDMTGGRGRVGYADPTEFTPPSPADRYMANAPGDVTEGVAGAENLQPSFSRFSPNVSGEVTAGIEGAEQLGPSWSRFSPNVPGMVDEGVEGAGGLLSGEQQAMQAFDRFMPNAPGNITGGVVEHTPLRQPTILRGADQYHVPGVGRPSGAPERAAFNTQTPTVVDDVVDAQASPALDEVDDIISGMGDAPMSVRAAKAKAQRERQESFRRELNAARKHGMGGFTNLPNMSDAEAERISQSIARITGR